MPDILFELKRLLENQHYLYHYAFDDDEEVWSFHDTVEVVFGKLNKCVSQNHFLNKFRGEGWLKYKEIEDIEGYGLSFLIHVIQYVDNSKTAESKKVLPDSVHSEKDILDYFNEYRYLMIENTVLNNLESIKEAYKKVVIYTSSSLEEVRNRRFCSTDL